MIATAFDDDTSLQQRMEELEAVAARAMTADLDAKAALEAELPDYEEIERTEAEREEAQYAFVRLASAENLAHVCRLFKDYKAEETESWR